MLTHVLFIPKIITDQLMSCLSFNNLIDTYMYNVN